MNESAATIAARLGFATGRDSLKRKGHELPGTNWGSCGADRQGLGAARAALAAQARLRQDRSLHLAGRARGLFAGRKRQPRAARPAQGHRPHARRALRQHCPLRARPSRQQRAPMGRPRHRQELPRQGGACGSQPRGEVASGRAEARRDPPRGHWLAATMSCASPRHQGQALHPVLRRPVLRGARHLLQIAEGGARRRHRRAARARAVLRDLEPAASHAAGDAGRTSASQPPSIPAEGRR